MRIWLVGFGTVGQWLGRVLDEQAGALAARYGLAPRVVGIATGHDGFIYAPDGQPGLAHLREALRRRIPAVTSDKWPVALDGVALAALARGQGVPFRAESTVMSGTPVLSTLTEGLAGARPLKVRGLRLRRLSPCPG